MEVESFSCPEMFKMEYFFIALNHNMFYNNMKIYIDWSVLWNKKKIEPIRDARKLGKAKMLILGIQHMFAMFGATILVPILVSGYFQAACGEELTRGLSVSVTLFCAGFGTLIFHLCTKFKVPAFLGSSFAFLWWILHSS